MNEKDRMCLGELEKSERQPFVSIIIPTYNRAHLLPQTLDSFLGQEYPPERYEIIVADNNSSDLTREVMAKYGNSSTVPVKYIVEKRQGVHFARNSAAKIAKGDILYFTDDDMVADRMLIQEIVNVFDLDPLIGSATGKIIGRFDVTPPTWVTKDLTNFYLSLTDKEKPEDLIVSRDDLVFSCHEAVRRDVFFQCGGFNPENTAGIWIGDGETGLGIKMKQRGYKFCYTSKSVIYHLIPESRTTLRYLIQRIGNQGYCDSYTAYRRHRKKKLILSEAVKRNTIGLVKLMGSTLIKVLLFNQSWRFIPAQIMYLHKRNLYDIRLFADDKFREIVEIDNWLDVDPNNFSFYTKESHP